ncbi:MAG: hypothetical protein WB816_05435 [Methylocystis sp.]
MVVSRESPFATRTSRIVLAVTAVASLCAAVAATPSASIGKETIPELSATTVATVVGDRAEAARGMRPLARGPAIRVGRAFDAEDEDCTLVVTKVTDESGRVKVKRGVTCAN